jgi:hypothetical protein
MPLLIDNPMGLAEKYPGGRRHHHIIRRQSAPSNGYELIPALHNFIAFQIYPKTVFFRRLRQKVSHTSGGVDTMNAEVLHPNLSGEERWRSISDLRKLGPSAVEYLIINLWDDDRMVRLAAVDALGEIGDARAFDHLESMLRDPDNDVRFACVVALGNLGDKRAVGALARACGDSNGFVRTMAREMIKKLESSGKS